MQASMEGRRWNDASPVLIDARGLGVYRAGRWLIDNVDITIRAGEIVSLIGPNGGGKSTTAKVILGILNADKGRLRRAENLRIGYVPQRLHIDRTLPLSVGRLMSLTGRQPDEDIDQALAEVGISHLAGAQVQTLSGGEFQRALLARALIRKPRLLVLDEPVQGVDFAGEIELYDLIGKLRDRYGCGILLISHDLHIVMAQTDTVVCLNGHVCCSGPPQTVASSAEYRHLFGARAADAFAVVRHRHEHQRADQARIVPLKSGRRKPDA